MRSDGKFTVEQLPGHDPLHPDEPIIVFRGRDVVLPGLLRLYADTCETLGSPEQHVTSARTKMDEVMAFQNEHGFKIPD